MTAVPSHLPVRDERAALLEQYHPLIFGLAHYWYKWNPTVGLDDLIQEGRIALLRAHEIYDPSRGANFLTYSRRRINADMRTHVANTRDTIRIPSDYFRKVRVPTFSLDMVVNKKGNTVQDIAAEPEREPQLSDDADLKALVLQAIEKLRPDQRTVVHQLYLVPQPLSRRELGAALGITRQAVELHLKKALRKTYRLKGAA